MKGLVLCNKGIEDIAAMDVKELVSREAEPREGYVLFEIENTKELCRLAYQSQSIKKVILVLDNFVFKTADELIKKAGEISFSDWLNKDRKFKVEVINSHDELSGEIGKSIIDGISDYKQEVDLEDPDIIVAVFLDGKNAIIGIDFSGIDLSKRDYRIFSNARDIKATLAYSIVRFSEYKKGETLLDPFCLSGNIAIEAALFKSGKAVRFFEKDKLIFSKLMEIDFGKTEKKNSNAGEIFCFDSQFRNIDAAKKNAKIAEINKTINFSRMDVEWIDTKLDKASVDKIVTCLPNITKFSNVKEMLKLYAEFFYQAEFVLKKEGKIAVCTRNSDKTCEAALSKGFKLEAEKEVWQGKDKLTFCRFSK